MPITLNLEMIEVPILDVPEVNEDIVFNVKPVIRYLLLVYLKNYSIGPNQLFNNSENKSYQNRNKSLSYTNMTSPNIINKARHYNFSQLIAEED